MLGKIPGSDRRNLSDILPTRDSSALVDVGGSGLSGRVCEHRRRVLQSPPARGWEGERGRVVEVWFSVFRWAFLTDTWGLCGRQWWRALKYPPTPFRCSGPSPRSARRKASRSSDAGPRRNRRGPDERSWRFGRRLSGVRGPRDSHQVPLVLGTLTVVRVTGEGESRFGSKPELDRDGTINGSELVFRKRPQTLRDAVPGDGADLVGDRARRFGETAR